jgi:hypothetical protein
MAKRMIEIEDEVEVSEYKGSPIITLPTGQERGFSFGLTKAKLIVEFIDNIKKFVETEGKEA